MFEVPQTARRQVTRSNGNGNIIAGAVTINLAGRPGESWAGLMGLSHHGARYSAREVALLQRFRKTDEAGRDCLVTLAEIVSQTEKGGAK